MAPPHRASAERRSNENAGAVAIPAGCSRATLMVVPYPSIRGEGYNVNIIGWQGRTQGSEVRLAQIRDGFLGNTRARWSKEDFQPVLRAAPPSAARLRRDGSRKRKRQKIATSQEQCLLPRVTRVQRSRIAANISNMAALIFENACRPCRTILQAD